MQPDDPMARLARLAEMENLADSLADRDGGELFQSDLGEARALAGTDPRFAQLVVGLEAQGLGERLAAVNRFFKSFEPVELASLQLPTHLSQLRSIYLDSR